MSIEISKIKLHIDFKLTEINTITDVAEHLKISSETLRKVFLREEKIPLGEYIISRKIEAMKELLILCEDPCYFVCYSVGFREDTGAKIFKKHSGTTMHEFRERAKKFCELVKQPDLEIKTLESAEKEMVCL